MREYLNLTWTNKLTFVKQVLQTSYHVFCDTALLNEHNSMCIMQLLSDSYRGNTRSRVVNIGKLNKFSFVAHGG